MTQEQRQMVEEQFALDYNCSVKDFQSTETLVTRHKRHQEARKFNDEDSLMNMLTYNGKLLITANEEILPWCEEVLTKRISAEWCFEVDSLIRINKKLFEFGYRIDQVHLFFLPKYDQPQSDIKTIILNEDEISFFEEDRRIDEAFLFDDYIKDVLGVAVRSDSDELLAVAGATANSERMWEIGYNSFVEGRGFGTAALSALLKEVIKLGKVPYCGTAISHLASQNIALKSGMVPAFSELRTVMIK